MSDDWFENAVSALNKRLKDGKISKAEYRSELRLLRESRDAMNGYGAFHGNFDDTF